MPFSYAQIMSIRKELQQVHDDLTNIERKLDKLKNITIEARGKAASYDSTTDVTLDEDRIRAIINMVLANSPAAPPTPSFQSKGYVTEKEAATFMGVSVFSLRSWRSKSSPLGPPFVKLGRLVRYSVADLERHLAGIVHRPTTSQGAEHRRDSTQLTS